MLLLSRKKGEAISIDDIIKIVVSDTHSNKCQLAIDCPKDIRIWRTELEGPNDDSKLTKVIDWSYDQVGMWIGKFIGHPMWAIEITPNGKFSIGLSDKQRLSRCNSIEYGSLHAAKLACERIEKSLLQEQGVVA